MLRKIYRQERLPADELEEYEQIDRYEEEWKEHILARSLEILKSAVRLQHYQIFYLLDINHYSVNELARLYDMPPVSIYSIRSRVEARLRKIVRSLDN